MPARELKVEAYASEFIGTYFLVLTIGLNVLQNAALAPVAIGSILMAMIFATGSVSGAHFNPAVTIGVLLSMRDQIYWIDVCVYIVVQLLAGLAAGGTYYWILGATFTLHPGAGFGALEVIVVEVLFTAALVFVVLNVATTQQDMQNHYYGLAIGWTVMASAFAIGAISGCSLNPAVTFGVMFSHLFHAGSGMRFFPHYFFAPVVGAVIAAGLFRVVRAKEFQPQEKQMRNP